VSQTGIASAVGRAAKPVRRTEPLEDATSEGGDAMKRETKLKAVAIFVVCLLIITLIIYLVAGVTTPSVWIGLILNASLILYVLLVFRFGKIK
jgi:hypothetical protein